VTVDGAPTAARVEAFVNGKECSFRSGIRSPHAIPDLYLLAVASEALIPGCGRPGDEVRFTIDGRPANETAVWQMDLSWLPLSTGQ
jgi:hypothetical protein